MKSTLLVWLLVLLASTMTLAQGNPVPLINQPLVPTATLPGGPTFTLAVNGTGFVSGAGVNWNGAALTTTFVNSSQLTATVPASNIATAGTASVTVTNPTPGGGTSNVMYFDVSTPVSTLTFASFYSFGEGKRVAAADFNGDGRLDLAGVTVNEITGINEAYVQLGNGDGSFQAPSTFAVGKGSVGPVAGDFNGDGKLDLAVANAQDGTVSVLLGNGDGTFGPQTTFAVNGPNTGDFFLVAGDFNGDGTLDLATGNNNSNNNNNATVSVLLGNGDGTFQSHIGYSVGGYMTGMTVGDFNGDGKLDIVCVGSVGSGTTHQVSMLVGNGDGTFQAAAQVPIAISATWLITADVNGDGKLDLVMTESALPDSISIWLGNGDGTFQSPSSFYTTGITPVFVAAGDLNADGKLDLAVPNANSNTVSIFLGNGDGTFQSKVDFPTDLSSVSNTPESVAVGDFNGDGLTDLAVLNANSTAPYNLSLTMLLQGALPSAVAVPPMLNFAPQAIGTTSAAQEVTLTNTGTATLTLSSIGITGLNAADFDQSNNCGPTLSVGGNCQVSVTFTPTAPGTRNATVNITDDGPGSPQVITLTGSTPPAPVVSISPTSLTFPTQYVGTSGLPQTVTVTNTGTAALTITSVTTSIADFGTLSNCTNSVAPNTNCTIGVFFDPTASGTRTGSLSITDNAAGSPHTVALSGTGQDFSLVLSGPTTATVTAGQTASYAVAVTPGGGFDQTVAMSCSGAPAQSTCSLSSSSVALNGSTGTVVNVAITTVAGSAGFTQPFSPPRYGGELSWLAFSGTLALAMLLSLARRFRERRPQIIYRLALLCALSLGVTMSACGGGGSGGSRGTQVGTYNVTVTGTFTSGSTTLIRNIRLTLVVQ